MKRVVTIQDISCVGKCSLTVALPLISVMGAECCVLPTAVLSTHTAFEGFTFRDLTSDLKKNAEHWKNHQLQFDAIYSGYLGSIEQIEIVSNIIDQFSTNGAVSIVDPCMADHGKFYKGFSKDFSDKMAFLCGKANIITPNITEAHFLLNLPYTSNLCTEESAKELVLGLAALGAQKIVLKGIEFEKDSETVKGTKEKIGILCYDSTTEKFSWYFHKKMPQNFHGTGDIFASVLTGGLMRGLSLESSASLAADFVAASIKATLSHTDYNWYGVDFETCIPYLVKRLDALPPAL